MTNPYVKKPLAELAPLLLKVPRYNFESGEAVEAELEREEMCVAAIPNTAKTGFEEHVALVYKDKEDNVFSLTFVQHHGILKPGSNEALEREMTTKSPRIPQGNRKKKKKKHGK